MRKIISWLAQISIIAILGTAHSVMATPQYRITDLGAISMEFEMPNHHAKPGIGINAAGQVTVTSYNREPRFAYAFRLRPNQMLNPVTDDLGAEGHNPFTSAINNAGQVVGYFSVNLNDDDIERAFRTAPNKPINLKTDDLGTLGCNTTTRALGINSVGQAVGFSHVQSYEQGDCNAHAFRTAPNKAINPATDDLGDLGGSFGDFNSIAEGINDSGQVVGVSVTADYRLHAFRTSPNKPINPATDDLGAFDDSFYNYSWANAINAAGQVVGYAGNSGEEHAFRTSANKPINTATDDLGTLGGRISSANSINSAGDVVGDSETSDLYQHAFLFTQGVMYDLNELIQPNSGWRVLSQATSINDKNQIVGVGTFADEKAHLFRLDPNVQ